MDLYWITPYIGPAVIAAGVSGIVSIAGFIVSGRTAQHIHTEKLAFDGKQTERRATAEIALVEHRAAHDMALAERKIALDQELAVWQRR
jgi:hypothetical protein